MTQETIAILGGGLGSMTAAFYLTSTPELRKKYKIKVYQLGWRLGGKGASGRNRKVGNRIEEHGIHLFMGFYENAFKTMKECYKEWKVTPENPFQTWEDAFTPQYFFSLEDNFKISGKNIWKTWNITMPELPGTPGDGIAQGVNVGYEIVQTIAEHITQYFEKVKVNIDLPEQCEAPSWFDGLLKKLESTATQVVNNISAVAAEVVNKLFAELRSVDPTPDDEILEGVIHSLEQILKTLEAEVERDIENVSLDIYRLWMLADIGIAAIKGYVRDILPYGQEGYQKINNLDFRAWLLNHGANPKVVANGSPIRAFYDMIFAYIEGNTDHPFAAAGTMFKIIFRLGFTYKKAPMFHMNAGMGDTIFSPFYEVLKERGVEFNFFHRVEELHLSGDRKSISKITLTEQVQIKDGQSYDPLFNVKGLPCWPSEPLWEQIVDGDKYQKQGINFESEWAPKTGIQKEIHCGNDFDTVLFGMSVGNIPNACKQLMEASPRWNNIVKYTPTVATQTFQLWNLPTLKGLGWNENPTVLTAYAENTDTWSVMNQVLNKETWPDYTQPKTISYFCGVYKNKETRNYDNIQYPIEMLNKVKENSIEWVNTNIAHLWPDAVKSDGTFNYSLLCDIKPEQQGVERFKSQFFKVNIDPSERYVLSVPGSIRFRMRADETSFENLYIAGDWLKTTINAGSVEAAVEGGMQAAKAIAKLDLEISGEETY